MVVGDAWGRPGFLLWHATVRWQRQVAAALTPLGLTHPQFLLLASTWYLQEVEGPPAQRDLVAHTGADPMTTSQVLRALESGGLVSRGPDGSDRRVVRVRCTAVGRRLAARAVAAVEAVDDAYFGADGPCRQDAVRALGALVGRPAGAEVVGAV